MTDEVSKIEFPKMAHIAQLVYETGCNVANLDHFPARDNKGPRKGKGADGEDQVRRQSAVVSRRVAVGGRSRSSTALAGR